MNQLLNAVGNDVVVRGLEITPEINIYKTGVVFKIAPGALIQDLTYFEFPTESTIEMDDLVTFENYQVIIYTNWRYLETTYDNPLKIEATLYNPKTRKTISGWSTYTNRIILGVYSFNIENEEISFVNEDTDTIYLEDSNVVQNGLFDTKSFKFWTAINSTLKINEDGGISGTPCLRVTPIADSYQGIAQVLQTKAGYDYSVTFSIRSDELFSFQALVLDGNSIYNMAAPEVGRYEFITPRNWVEHTFKFHAITNYVTLFFLKMSETVGDIFEIDSIQCLEYLESRKTTDINKIKAIDGGLLVADGEEPTPPVEPGDPSETSGELTFQNWTIPSVENQFRYDLMGYKHNIQNENFVFYGTSKLSLGDYYLDSKGQLRLNFEPDAESDDICVYSVGYNKSDVPVIMRWDFNVTPGKTTYFAEDGVNLRDPDLGVYMVFYGANLLNDTDYTISYEENKIVLDSKLVTTKNTTSLMSVYYANLHEMEDLQAIEWNLLTADGLTDYNLAGIEDVSQNGFYLVFYGPNKLNEKDYSIGTSSLHLNFEPSDDNIITVYRIGKKDSGGVMDNEFIIKRWEIMTNTNQIQYNLDGYSPAGNEKEIVFYDGGLLDLADYKIAETGRIVFDFTPDSSDVAIDILSLGFSEQEESVLKMWTFTTTPGTKSYYPREEAFKDPDDGIYMVFYGADLLDPMDYIIDIETDKITLTDDLSQSSVQLTICYISKSETEKLDVHDWHLKTAAGERMYSLANEEIKEGSQGSYLVFYGPTKLRSTDYAINNGSSLQLGFTPLEVGTPIHVYYIGEVIDASNE